MRTTKKKTKKGLEYQYEEPENLAEAVSVFGEEKVFGAFLYWQGVRKSQEVNAPPRAEGLSPELREKLKDPKVREMVEMLLAQQATAGSISLTNLEAAS